MGKWVSGWVVKAVEKAHMQRPKNERVWCLGELPVVYYGMGSIGKAGICQIWLEK